MEAKKYIPYQVFEKQGGEYQITHSNTESGAVVTVKKVNDQNGNWEEIQYVEGICLTDHKESGRILVIDVLTTDIDGKELFPSQENNGFTHIDRFRIFDPIVTYS